MRALLFLVLAVALSPATAAERSSAQRAAFMREHPCPATGKTRGPCPGYVVDHIVPLCADGQDAPANMQWQTIDDAKEKDKDEWRICRAFKCR